MRLTTIYTIVRRFSREKRLRNAREYARVFKGAGRSADHMVVVLGTSNGERTARLGLAIAKKYVHKAVHRNRIKRVIRESFRRHQDELRGLDVVVVGRRGLRDADTRTLSGALAGHWKSVAGQCREP